MSETRTLRVTVAADYDFDPAFNHEAMVRDLFKLRPTDLVIFERVQPVRSEPAAASVPLPVSAPTGAEGPAKTWFDECEENR
jgi:hypothetical protein